MFDLLGNKIYFYGITFFKSVTRCKAEIYSSCRFFVALNMCMVNKQVSVKYRAAHTDLEVTPFGTDEPSPFSWGVWSLCAGQASPSVRPHS